MTLLYFAAGFGLFLLVAVHVLRLRVLMGMPIALAKLELCSVDEIDEATLATLKSPSGDLEKLGFRFSHFHRSPDPNADNGEWHYAAVFLNDDTACCADVTPNHMPEQCPLARVDFSTVCGDLNVCTMNGYAFSAIRQDGRQRAFDEICDDHGVRYRAHLEHVRRLEAEHDPGPRRRFEGGEDYVRGCNAHAQQHFQFLLQEDLIRPDGDGYRLRLQPARRMLKQLLAAEKIRKGLPSPVLSELEMATPEERLDLQVKAYEQHQRFKSSLRVGSWFKTMAFGASAIAFALLFGVAWSFELVLWLIPILLFHEFGHIAAMRLFGYQDLQILFLPIGAAAVGQKNSPTAMQKAIVSLAGPVPGILLAGVVLAAGTAVDLPAWLYTGTVMMLILNYINLLPFRPLDGGHLVDALMLSRFPRLQVVFTLVSALVFIVVALNLFDPIVTILGVVLLWGLPEELRSARLVMAVRKAHGRQLGERDAIRALFEALSASSKPFMDKMETVKSLVPLLVDRPARAWEIVAGLVLYLGVLAGPVAVLVNNPDMPGASFFAGGAGYDEAWTTEIYRERLAVTADPHERRVVLVTGSQVAADSGDIPESMAWANEALEISQDLGAADDLYAEAIGRMIYLHAYMTEDDETAREFLVLLEATLSDSDPRLAEALQTLALQPGVVDAVELLERAAKIYLDSDDLESGVLVMLDLAEAHLASGQVDAAEAQYLRATRMDSGPGEFGTSALALQSLGDFYFGQEREEAALRQYRLSVDAAPDDSFSAHFFRNAAWAFLVADDIVAAQGLMHRAQGLEAALEEEIFTGRGTGMWHRLSRLWTDSPDRMVSPEALMQSLAVAHENGDSVEARRLLLRLQDRFADNGASLPADYIDSWRQQADATGGFLERKAELIVRVLTAVQRDEKQSASLNTSN